MAQDSDAPERRLTGDAAWKAARDETERRNSEAKRRASEQTTATAAAAIQRERHMAAAEREQLKVLNARIDARTAGHSAAVGGGTPGTDL
ncbi:MAG TPA: hypothetical protein VH247_10260 [Thermoleophilaceae bacterium]|nr:hypothetical protein [Thermoleophilaceae bacterium]